MWRLWASWKESALDAIRHGIHPHQPRLSKCCSVCAFQFTICCREWYNGNTLLPRTCRNFSRAHMPQIRTQISECWGQTGPISSPASPAHACVALMSAYEQVPFARNQCKGTPSTDECTSTFTSSPPSFYSSRIQTWFDFQRSIHLVLRQSCMLR